MTKIQSPPTAGLTPERGRGHRSPVSSGSLPPSSLSERHPHPSAPHSSVAPSCCVSPLGGPPSQLSEPPPPPLKLFRCGSPAIPPRLCPAQCQVQRTGRGVGGGCPARPLWVITPGKDPGRHGQKAGAGRLRVGWQVRWREPGCSKQRPGPGGGQ